MREDTAKMIIIKSLFNGLGTLYVDIRLIFLVDFNVNIRQI
jgi:hypothetical protein